MTVAHIVLSVFALVMAIEACWAIATPVAMRNRVRQMLDEADDAAGPWHLFFWILTLLCWWVAWYGQTAAHRALFFIGVFFMVTGFLAQRPAFLECWYGLFLGRRSATGIRLIYTLELALAVVLAAIAAGGF